MTNSKKAENLKISLNHRIRSSEDRIEIQKKNLQSAVVNGFEDVCNHVKWYANGMMKDQYQYNLWMQVKEVLDADLSEEEMIVWLTDIERKSDERFRSCNLMNMRVDGTGISELSEHEALGEFLRTFSDILYYYNNQND